MSLCLPDHSNCDCYPGTKIEVKACLEMIFDSQEHLEAFTSWLSNSGEQGYYEQGSYEPSEEAHLYHTNLDYTHHNKVIVTEIPKEDQ